MKAHDHDHVVPEVRALAERLGDLAVEMQALTDSVELLEAIASAAVDIVPGATWAGIELVPDRRVTPETPTDDVATRLNRLQTELGDGPALSAMLDHRPVLIDEFGAEPRWPDLRSTASALGVHSMLSLGLSVTGVDLGALNLYGAAPQAFSPDAVAIGEILAQHAAVAIAGALSGQQLRCAVASRDVIGQAKGMLMQRDGLTGAQAFTALTHASQETNIKLAEVARTFVADHETAVDAIQESTKRSR